jgi:hypothetical protein
MNAREQIIHEVLNRAPNDKSIQAALAVLHEQPQARHEPQGLLNVGDACKWLGHVSRTSLWRHRRHGLRSVRLGGRVCFRVRDLEEFVNRRLETNGDRNE